MTAVDADAVVSLRAVQRDNVRQVLELQVAPHQEGFVASNAVSLAEAYVTGERAWPRVIYADETPVGFLMVYDDPRRPRYYLWRFMVDARYQALGFGRKAMQLLIDHIKQRPAAAEIVLSYAPGEDNPGPFYRKLGFEETGEVHGRERVMRLGLTYAAGEQATPAIGAALTHVVLFRCQSPVAENRAALIAALQGLVGQVPALRGLEVGADVLGTARSYDVALIARFDDRAGLEAYQTHPAHVAALQVVRAATTGAVAVDFES
jgi:diamine N-acetyltransferase